LVLHPKKIYLQSYDKGVRFLGVYIKPYRIYIEKRSKNAFYKAMDKKYDDFNSFVSSINSYLGLMSCYDTYKLRKKILFGSNNIYKDCYYFNGDLKKVIPNKKGKNKLFFS
jgi:hypothetical protein